MGRTHTQRNDSCAFKIVTRSPTVVTNMKMNETMTKRKSKQINMIRLSSFFQFLFFCFLNRNYSFSRFAGEICLVLDFGVKRCQLKSASLCCFPARHKWNKKQKKTMLCLKVQFTAAKETKGISGPGVFRKFRLMHTFVNNNNNWISNIAVG